jgi:hypothetical protein
MRQIPVMPGAGGGTGLAPRPVAAPPRGAAWVVAGFFSWILLSMRSLAENDT